MWQLFFVGLDWLSWSSSIFIVNHIKIDNVYYKVMHEIDILLPIGKILKNFFMDETK